MDLYFNSKKPTYSSVQSAVFQNAGLPTVHCNSCSRSSTILHTPTTSAVPFNCCETPQYDGWTCDTDG